MAYTRTQELALAFAVGDATAEQVVAAAKDSAPDYVTGDYDDIGARMQTDDFNKKNYAGWDWTRTALQHRGPDR